MNPKYEEFINGTRTIMETTFIMDYLEDYEQEDIQQKINTYISQLQQYLKGYRHDLPNIIYEERLFKQKWLELAFNLDFSEEDFGNLIKTCFGKYSPSFIIMNMKQKDVKYLESVLKNIPIINDTQKAVEQFEETLGDISERKNSNSEHGLEFDENAVISALKTYLIRHEKYLSDPSILLKTNFELDEDGKPLDLPLTKVILYHLNNILTDNTYKIREYMPLLPQANENEELFKVSSNAICEIKVNKGALINKYSKLLIEEHIDQAFNNLFKVLNSTKLSGLTSIVYHDQHPNHKEEVNLLFMFATPESFENHVLIKFIHDVLDIYCENYSVVTYLTKEESATLQKGIHNCWLDAKLPNKNVEKSTKLKI